MRRAVEVICAFEAIFSRDQGSRITVCADLRSYSYTTPHHGSEESVFSYNMLSCHFDLGGFVFYDDLTENNVFSSSSADYFSRALFYLLFLL